MNNILQWLAATSVRLHLKFVSIIASKNVDKTHLSPLEAFAQ